MGNTRIKYFLLFSCNKRIFSIKKFRFHIYISGRKAKRNYLESRLDKNKKNPRQIWRINAGAAKG